MISLPQLKEFLDELLVYNPNINAIHYDPYSGNGMQYKGKDEINKIGVGVTASLKLFQKAADIDCDSVITHHGLRWPDTPHYLKTFQERYSFLAKRNISLFAYHFLLDSHPAIGHSEIILNKLGIQDTEVFSDSAGPWGRQGQLSEPTPISDIIEECKDLFKNEDLIVYKFGKEVVRNIVVVTGSGAPQSQDLQKLIDEKVDLYITGSVKEATQELFREAEKNLIAGGHYATERLGMIELQKKLEEEFGENVEVEFIEVWNST
jgi:dinuclear metal center YbgI/SA1388 family protein